VSMYDSCELTVDSVAICVQFRAIWPSYSVKTLAERIQKKNSPILSRKYSKNECTRLITLLHLKQVTGALDLP